ncbi:MAG TPA: type II secretion system protein [Pirellulales bacterium]|nr:type II secretion system protein [Pirellulales bacterium]
MPRSVPPRPKRACRPAGFTLVESLVATTITAVAGSALLWGISAALQNTNATREQSIAGGLAQQLMDEIATKFYCVTKNSPYDNPLGPTSSENSGLGRSLYSSLSAYNGLRSEPATDPYGVCLGLDDGTGLTRNAALQAQTFFENWREEVDVYYVSNTDQTTKLSAAQTSDYRCVEIRIYYDDPTVGLRLITTQKRVFAYVAAP